MDYAKLGLKCGLEIHQQLSTNKLFCSCSSVIRDDAPSFKISRNLRASAGETGETDIAALQEHQRNRNFIYEGYKDTTCLVELDEEPPNKLNSEALYIALEVSLMLKADPVDMIQTMRKTVIDGSNTSGFQRTALIARNGILKTKSGSVSIKTISIEEDSARLISEDKDTITYRLDRLGIPLIEIGTGADITTPQQCLEAASKLGMLLRSTGKVKRGLGTIRQDVNISIKGGSRIEIKGAQELQLLPTLVEHEVIRQASLIEIAQKLAARKAKLAKQVIDVTPSFKAIHSGFIPKVLASGGVVLGMKLSGFAGLLGKEVQLGRRLGTELSDHAKIKAGVGGIIHSDEDMQKYGLDTTFCSTIGNSLMVKSNDAYVLVAASREKAEKALYAVFERALESIKGVPSEVRKANADGTTSYLRPMPGAARMYPETDTELIKPDTKHIKLPELLDKKINRFAKLGLSDDLAENIAKSERSALFEELVKKHANIKPAYTAEVLTAKLTELRRDYGVDSGEISDDSLREVFGLLASDKLQKEIMLKVLSDVAAGKFDVKNYSAAKINIEKELKEIISKNKGAPFGALMGIAVNKLKGKASGKDISEMLQRLTIK